MPAALSLLEDVQPTAAGGRGSTDAYSREPRLSVLILTRHSPKPTLIPGVPRRQLRRNCKDQEAVLAGRRKAEVGLRSSAGRRVIPARYEALLLQQKIAH